MNDLTLLAPVGLVALIALPLIILFHMRHSTPVELDVPTLRFWQAAVPTTTEDSRLRIPPVSLLLLLQLLAALAIGLALARPAVSETWAGLSQRSEPSHLVVVLDGSTSMSAIDDPAAGTRFEIAQREASSRVAALAEGDVATVLLAGSQLQTFAASTPEEVEALATDLATMPLPGGVADFNTAIELVSDLDIPGLPEEIVVITDGAIAVDPAVAKEAGGPIELVQTGMISSANLAIVGMEPRASAEIGATVDIAVDIANFTDEAFITSVRAEVDGFQVFDDDVSIDQGGITTVVISGVPEAATDLTVEVRSDDVLFDDNRARMRLQTDSRFALRILLVADLLSPLTRALNSVPGAIVDTITSADDVATSLQQDDYDLVVLDGVDLPGGSNPATPIVFVNSPVGGNFDISGVMTSPEIDQVLTNDPLLTGVDLTGATFGETPAHSLESSDIEVVGAPEGPLLYRTVREESGQPVIVLPFNLVDSNLPTRIAFPILISNIVAELSPEPLPASVQIGDTVAYSPYARTVSVLITDPLEREFELRVPAADSTETSRATGSDRANQDLIFTSTGTPGEYEVTELNASGQPLGRSTFVVNAGHPVESNLHGDEELPKIFGLTTGGADSPIESILSDIWPALVGLGLILLGLEWMLAPASSRSFLRNPLRRTR